MKILIRCDSSIAIGTGHVYRCLTLAIGLRNKGAEVLFVCRALKGNIMNLIEEKQFKVVPLPSHETASFRYSESDIYERWRGVDLETELKEIHTTIDTEKPNLVLVDHYSLSKDWEEFVQKMGPSVIAIDDIFREHSCFALLDQNFHQSHEAMYKNKLSRSTRLFLGPEYALLSEQFTKLSFNPKTYTTIKSVLMFFGGTDPDGFTLKYLDYIRKFDPTLTLNVVVGKQNPYLDEIKIESQKSKIRLHIQTNEMAKLMCESDLYIGAGGSITWERSYLGLPAICMAIAENQIKLCEELNEIGAHIYLGRAQDITYEKFEETLKNLVPETLNNLSKNSLKLHVTQKAPEFLNFIIKTF